MTTTLVTTELEDFLKEVERRVRPRKERTLFSLGGRGYYENPASDLLAFFLNPNAEHGFKALFLQAFLECMKVDFANLGMEGVTVSREDKTEEGNRTDVVVQGTDWVLLIENKVYHIQGNPFESYEAYGRSLPGGKNLMMGILSPKGESVHEKWKPVSYQAYCAALRRRLAEDLFDRAYSKWVVFAREFILHFENELYQPTMNNQEADFVEQNAKQIKQTVNLAREYRDFLLQLLEGRLRAAITGYDFRTKDEDWGIRFFSEKWGRSHLAFLPPSSEVGPKFLVRVYLVDLTPEQKEQARRELQAARRMEPRTEGKWLSWTTQPGFEKRNDAVDELCKLGSVLAELFKSPPEPVPSLASK